MSNHSADPSDVDGYYAETAPQPLPQPPPQPPPQPLPQPPPLPEPQSHPHLALSAPALVILSIVAGITVVCVAMVLTHAAEQAVGVIIPALLLGAGLAIGFRKRWTR